MQLSKVRTAGTLIRNYREESLTKLNTKISSLIRPRMASMRGRYLLLAVFFAVFLVTVSLIAQQLLTRAADHIYQGNSNHQKIREQLYDLRIGLQDIQLSLQDYLVVPSKSKNEKLQVAIDFTLYDVRVLAATEWQSQQNTIEKEMQILLANLEALAVETRRLVVIRRDLNQLYPSTNILLNEMLPENDRFYAAATNAIYEAKEFEDEKGQMQLHHLFQDLRHSWTMMVSAWRAYVANRSGIFAKPEVGMRVQRTNLLIHAEKVDHLLEKIASYEKRELLGMEQAESIQVLRDANINWHRGYRKASKILSSPQWRMDIPVFRTKVRPLLIKSSNNIRTLERALHHAVRLDTENLTHTAGNLTLWLWLMALIGAALSMGGFLLLELTVRKPLAHMVSVFKAESIGPSDAPLPVSNLKETHDLVAAFSDMRDQVRSRQQRLETILDTAAEGIITFNEDGIIESINVAAEELFGFNEAELVGKDLTVIIPPEKLDSRDDYIAHFLRHEIQRCIGHEGEITGRHKNGSRFTLALKVSAIGIDGKTIYTGLVADISERKAMVEHLKHMAEHDGLTGLYNRSYFQDELDHISEQVRRNNDRQCALMYIDLDNFKYVNDTMGHAAGDKLLLEVSEILAKRARKSDLLARFGGDEFTVLLADTPPERAYQVAESFRVKLADYQFKHEGNQVDIGCSIGVAQLTSDNYLPEEVMSQADLACHLAKKHGRNRVHIYNIENESDVTNMSLDMGWSRRIKIAIEQNRFVLARQPIVDAKTREKHSYEVLVRLLGEDNGLVLPGGFMPSAERFGLAADIDHWVIVHALLELSAYRKHLPGLRYSINLSAMTLTDLGVCDLIEQQLKETKLDPTALTFEVTETSAIADMASAVRVLTRIKALGCYTALDDFGTGMSSFAYLKDLPVDIVKIDGRFVKNLADSPIDQAMVRAMNDIAHALGKITVAEFVENEESFQLLQQFGVDRCQGHLLGKPELSRIDGDALPQPAKPKSNVINMTR